MADRSARSGRLRVVPAALAVGVVASTLLGLSTTGTLSSFTAQLNNSNDTAASGSLVMTETGTSGTSGSCSTASGTNGVFTCSTINKFGGSTTMVPGSTSSASIAIGNAGTAAAATFTLAPTSAGTSPNYGCSTADVGSNPGTATDACTQFAVVIASGATTIYSGSLSGLRSINLRSVTPVGGGTPVDLAPLPGATTPFTFTVTLPAGSGNAYQGKQVSMPLTWSFGAGS